MSALSKIVKLLVGQEKITVETEPGPSEVAANNELRKSRRLLHEVVASVIDENRRFRHSNIHARK